MTQATTAPTTHRKLLAWVERVTELVQPDEVLLGELQRELLRHALSMPYEESSE